MATKSESGEYEKDFTPKTAKSKINKKYIIIAAAVVLFVGIVIGGYFIYDGIFYYQTDNAKVDTSIFQLTANANGKLVNLYATEGQQVKAGQALARVDNNPIIVSPIDGTVTDIKMQEGDYVTPSNSIMVVAKTSDMYITANVEETNILEIHKGQSVSVSLDAYGKSYDGFVNDVSTVTSTKLTGSTTSYTTSGTYTKVTQLIPVKIKLRDPVDLADIIGTNATVKIRIK